jgi:hypothetical protein
MQYVLLIHEDESFYEGEEGATKLEEVVGKHMALIEDMNAAQAYIGGNRLLGAGTATTIRYNGGEGVLHDGPFAETHEELGGYYVIEAASLDDALDWARKIPVPGDGAVEVRPIWQYEE